MQIMKRTGEILRQTEGMELVQVAILVAIAIGIGLIFKSNITTFVKDVFDGLTVTSF